MSAIITSKFSHFTLLTLCESHHQIVKSHPNLHKMNMKLRGGKNCEEKEENFHE